MGTYLSLHFSVRARALSSFLTRGYNQIPSSEQNLTYALAVITIPMVMAFGKVLDMKRWSQKKRAWIGFALWVIPQIGCFIWIGIEYGKFGKGKAKLDYLL